MWLRTPIHLVFGCAVALSCGGDFEDDENSASLHHLMDLGPAIRLRQALLNHFYLTTSSLNFKTGASLRRLKFPWHTDVTSISHARDALLQEARVILLDTKVHPTVSPRSVHCFS